MNLPLLEGAAKALSLRAKALELLKEAQQLDGYKAFAVTHRFKGSASTYLVWSKAEPSEQAAASVLDAEYEPDLGEELFIESALSLDEITGVSVASRILPTD